LVVEETENHPPMSPMTADKTWSFIFIGGHRRHRRMILDV